MSSEHNSRISDFNAEQNLTGKRMTWINNAYKIDYVLGKARKHFTGSRAGDFGLGNGHTIQRYLEKGYTVTGVDISDYIIEYLRSKFSDRQDAVNLIGTDITTLEIDQKINVISCFDILEHIPGDGIHIAIRKLAGLLENDGVFICTLPIGEDPADNMARCPKCNFQFHKNGHHHFFDDTDDALGYFKSEFTLIKMGIVPKKRMNIVFLDLLFTYYKRFIAKVLKIKKSMTYYFIFKKKA